MIRVYARTARPIILRYFNRRSCVASSRITIEALKFFGIAARPVPVRFLVRAPALNAVFMSGVTAEDRAEIAGASGSRFVLLAPGPQISGGGIGWNGHVIVKTREFLIDPSFDQALDAIAGAGHAIAAAPLIAVFPLGGKSLPKTFHAGFTALLDDDTKIISEYDHLPDDSFLRAPAWELDHLQPAIEQILAAMKGIL